MSSWRAISSKKKTPSSSSSINGSSMDTEFVWVSKDDLAAAAETAGLMINKTEFLKYYEPEKAKGQTLKKTEFVKKSSVLPRQAAIANSRASREVCYSEEWSPVYEGIVPWTHFHTDVLGIHEERLASNVDDCINNVLYGNGKSRFPAFQMLRLEP